VPRTVAPASDLPRIAHDLAARVSERNGSPADWSVGEVAQLAGGHSGFTYVVRTADDDRRLVLRLSPPNARIVGPADVGRQGRIMAAAGAAGLPVPRVLDYSSEPVIDGRAFVLMDWVAGEPWDRSGLSHREVGGAAADLAGRIGQIDVAASGIADESPLSPAEEVHRWAALLPRSPEWLQAPGTRMSDQLIATAPRPDRIGLIHGDFHYGNLMFRDGRVVAVVDWEIASLGDPLFDLGALAVAGLRRRYAPEPNPTGSVEVEVSELARMYGADERRFAWFVAASCFKYSAILGYNYELHRRGKRVDPLYESLLDTTRGLIDDAHDLLKAAS
jgi:aminoglycoside phosphotransferase (APT) family kinase protein